MCKLENVCMHGPLERVDKTVDEMMENILVSHIIIHWLTHTPYTHAEVKYNNNFYLLIFREVYYVLMFYKNRSTNMLFISVNCKCY